MIGDPGTCIDSTPKPAPLQGVVAALMQKAFDQDDSIRFVLTTGDNLYDRGGKILVAITALRGKGLTDTGKEDDAWFLTFFQPYRHIINRIPRVSRLGQSRRQGDGKRRRAGGFAGQFLHWARFPAPWGGETRQVQEGQCWRQGLFYAFHFVAVDCSKPRWAAEPYLTMAENRSFLAKEFAPRTDPASPWRIVFGHHPPFCAGPSHKNGDGDIKRVRKHLWPLLSQAGVRLSFWGHEHNFQWFKGDAGEHYIVTSAAGKAETDEPSTPESWGARKRTQEKGAWPDLQ